MKTKCKTVFAGIIFLALSIFASCGKTVKDNLCVAVCTAEELVFDDPGISRYYSLGVQSNNGFKIRLLAQIDNGYKIYTQESGRSAILLFDDLQIDDLIGGFVDQDGNYYFYGVNQVIAYSPEGNEIASFQVRQTIRQIIPGENNKCYVLASNGSSYALYEMDLSEKNLTRIPVEDVANEFDIGYLYYGNKCLHLVGSFGLYSIDIKKGKYKKVFDFDGSTYSFTDIRRQIVGIKYVSDNKIIVFDSDGHADTIEYVNISREREVVILRTGFFRNGPLLRLIKDSVANYNSFSNQYYIYVDAYDDSEVYDAFASKTNAMISAGEIDLLFLNANNYDSDELIKGGKLINIRPMLEAKGVRIEEYYPIVFNSLDSAGEGIFAVNVSVWGEASAVSSIYRDLEDVEDLSLDAFLSRIEKSGERVKLSLYQSKTEETLNFLCTSKSLCGSVDWETRTCSFNNEKFKHLITSINSYETDGTSCAYAIGRMVYSPIDYISEREAAYEDDLIALPGVFFDDGIYPVFTDGDELVILNNSKHKEAAIDFICYLLSDEVQRKMPDYHLGIGKRSVDKEYVSSLVGMEVTHSTINPTRLLELEKISRISGLDAMFEFQNENKGLFERNVIIDEYSMEEFIRLKERIRPYPFRNGDVLNIIGEELEAYYSGEKSFEEVCVILDSRVGLYLSEKRD